MTYKLAEYDYPLFICDRCHNAVCSSRSTKSLWNTLASEGWLRFGENNNLCGRCLKELNEKPPPLATTLSSAVELAR